MGRIDLLNGLLAGGYRFAEVAIHQSMKPECVLPKALERHLGEFSLHVANGTELKQIFDAIDGGMIFRTDKISLNPRFGPMVAARRYGNWMRDEIAREDTYPYIISRGCKAIGFSVLKYSNNDSVIGLLSGLMDASRFAGLGIYLGYYTVEAARKMGAKRVKAHISSNNPSVMKVNQMLGYQIESMHYVSTRLVELS